MMSATEPFIFEMIRREKVYTDKMEIQILELKKLA
mgnify:CR=1 FL=1